MSIAEQFRRRARLEAHRYGGDEWVFVRELLQNSRDAGAAKIELEIGCVDGRECVVCRDDGRGMSFDHARRYLFTLYASSKTTTADTAGRFGIGFWSVLRFEPDEIIVRSAEGGAEPWELRLSGDLETIERRPAGLNRGTEIVLTRARRDSGLERRVWRAVRRDARHLRRLHSDEVVDVWVNGRRATGEIDLPAPSLSFSRRGFRGAVALAEQPKVDLLAHGLRVRTVATLDELLTQPERRRARRSVPDQLVPEVILDSRKLQVLMARGDARTDGELRRLVELGRRAVRRLVRRQLARGTTLRPIAAVEAAVREAAAGLRRPLATATVALVLALAASSAVITLYRSPAPGSAARIAIAADNRAGASRPPPEHILAGDARAVYGGPAVRSAHAAPEALALRYRPAEARPLFAVLRISSMTERGRVGMGPVYDAVQPAAAPCDDACLEVRLDLADAVDRVRLPVPTGHLIDAGSLRVDGAAAEPVFADDGAPIVVLDGAGPHRIDYRTGQGIDSGPSARGSWPSLPTEAERLAGRLQSAPDDVAVETVLSWVKRRVVYDTSDATADRHRRADAAGLGFVARCLEVGAGDCDVVNTVVASILHRAGLTVRLAIGVVGADGVALPGLHAWVELRRPDGSWRPIDASAEIPAFRSSSAQGAGDSAPDPVEPTERGGILGSVWRVARSTSVAGAAGVSVAFFVGIAGLVLWRRRLVVGSVRLADEPDIAGLLRGALARPDSFRDVPAVFTRPAVPLLSGQRISLRRARSLARRGALAAGRESSAVSRAARSAGRAVIDVTRSEGAAVSSVLGAVELAVWDDVATLGRRPHPIPALETAAAAHGLCWKLKVLPESAVEVRAIDGIWVGLAKNELAVCFGEDGRAWSRAAALAQNRPSAALLVLADAVVAAGVCIDSGVRRLLAALALAAIEERLGGRR